MRTKCVWYSVVNCDRKHLENAKIGLENSWNFFRPKDWEPCKSGDWRCWRFVVCCCSCVTGWRLQWQDGCWPRHVAGIRQLSSLNITPPLQWSWHSHYLWSTQLVDQWCVTVLSILQFRSVLVPNRAESAGVEISRFGIPVGSLVESVFFDRKHFVT